MSRDPVDFFRRVGTAVGEAKDLAEAMGAALEELRILGGWPAAHGLVTRDEATDELESRWHVDDPDRFAELQRVTERLVRRHGDGFLHRVAASRVPLLAAGLDELEPARREAAEGIGLAAVCALPILAEGVTVAAFELFLEEREEPAGAERDAIEFVRGQLELVAGRVRETARNVRGLRQTLDETAAALLRTEEAYALVRQAAGEGIWEWEPAEDRARFAPRWASLLGLEPAEVGDRPEAWLDRIHPEDRDRVELELRDHMEGVTELFESRHRVLHADGSYRWALARGLALRDEEGTPVRIAGTLADITDLKMLEERASRDLLYHPLTGFPRPALLLDRLEHAIRRGSRHPERSVGIIAIELEGLEGATRSIGSRGREELLLSVAWRLASALRPGDSVGHGPEFPFAVLLEDIESAEEALQVARRIETGLARPFPVEDREMRLTPYLGVALFHSGYEKPESLLLDATLAMKRSRKRGGIQVFDASAREEAEAAGDLEADLRTALTREELFLEYQPIVALDDGRITGLEALLRWMDPARGLVAPDHFLPTAEQAGLVEELGYWVLNRACRQMKEWQDRLRMDFPPSLAVNLTERQFYDPELTATTTGILKATGMEFSRLRFDVAESVFMRDPSGAARILTGLKARGIRVAIDDFGSGFSSISLLHRFPVSALKIDRWFISGQTAKLREWDVAQTVIELAGILGLEVIAEGIETREQFQRLRNLGCHQGQGFFFAGPVRPEEAEGLLRDGYPLDLAAPVR